MRFIGNRDIAVSVKNLESSRRFYEDVLGFKVERVDDKLAVYNTGHFTLYVQEGEPHPPVPSLTVQDIDIVRNLLVETGCVIVTDRGTSLYFRDPDGNLWDIIED